MKFPAEDKAKLLEALRSGNYQQGHSRLREGDKYCCLGVYCDLKGAKWELVNPDLNTYKVNLGNDYHLDTEFYLPKPFRTKENDAHGSIEELTGINQLCFSLAGLNDDGFTFAQIADIIEHFM